MEFWTRKVVVAMGHEPESLRLSDFEHVGRGVELAEEAFRSRDLRRGGVSIAGEILMRWRTPYPQLMAELAGCVEDRGWWSADALDVLAAVAASDPLPEFASVVPLLVEAVGADDGRTAAAAALALARLRHPAAVELVQRWLVGRLPFVVHPVRFGHILAPMVEHAGALLPGVRATLVARGEDEVLRSVLIALASWGPVAAPAVPELMQILRTRNARWACAALGSIGPAAVSAAGLLGRFARGSDRPPRTAGGQEPVDPRGWHGSQVAGWAHWKVTDEPETAVTVLGAAVAKASIAGSGHCDLSLLADMGSHAARYAEPVRAHLASPGPWTRVQAALAWWRITGDPEPVVPVLMHALIPLKSGLADDTCRAAVRCLAEIGMTAATAAAPMMEMVVASDRRFSYDAGPLAVSQDVELCRGARAVLEAAQTEDSGA